MDNVEEVLEHFGIKGMHWGVRKSQDSGGGKSKPPAKGKSVSVDAARAQKVQKKLKTRGLSSLSNDDLKRINERMRLEQQYAELTGKNASPLAKRAATEGGNFARNVLLGTGQDLAKKVLTQKGAALLVKQGLLVAKGG